MKILHVRNIANVADTIAKWQCRQGHEVTVVDVVDTPSRELICWGAEVDRLATYRELLQYLSSYVNEYDVVHAHSGLKLPKLIRGFGFRGSLIFTGHGTNVRRNGWSKVRYESDALTAVSEDLVTDEDIRYIPNAPDPELFSRKGPMHKGTALGFIFGEMHSAKSPVEEWERWCTERSLVLTKHDRVKDVFANNSFARYLELFEYFLDDKIYKGEPLGFSLTGLQALALGTKVRKGPKIFTRLPNEFKYENVMRKYDKVYEESLC